MTTPLFQYINQVWDQTITPTLCEFIKIPNKSPDFDPDWKAQGHMESAAQLLKHWCLSRPIKGLKAEVCTLEDRTPLLLVEVEGQSPHTALLYGHFDKQPEMEGWRENLGPWQPVIEEDRLYGRGGGDDGYAMFSALSAIEALQQQHIPHPRCILLIEGCEESGSRDLPYYMDHLSQRIGKPDLVVGLDSGAGNYDQLWCTTSIRGLLIGTLSVKTLECGVHSGLAGGVVPSVFQMTRALLSRVENEHSGEILLPALHTQIPENRQIEAKAVGEQLGSAIWEDFPFSQDVRPLSEDPATLILNQTWRPSLAVLGSSGIPDVAIAGNVLLPHLTLKLAFRLPPTTNPDKAALAIKTTFENNPPFDAHVSFSTSHATSGWNASPLAPWLEQCLTNASQLYYQQPPAYMGTGGGIPFISMLAHQFPQAQFVVTGVLGPESNAHGPNEFLDIPMAKKVTCCVAEVLKSQAEQT